MFLICCPICFSFFSPDFPFRTFVFVCFVHFYIFGCVWERICLNSDCVCVLFLAECVYSVVAFSHVVCVLLYILCLFMFGFGALCVWCVFVSYVFVRSFVFLVVCCLCLCFGLCFACVVSCLFVLFVLINIILMWCFVHVCVDCVCLRVLLLLCVCVVCMCYLHIDIYCVCIELCLLIIYKYIL